MLEELGAEYRVHPIDIGQNEQFHPDFLAISPNNKIPAIVDTENDLTLMESGAILLYLAKKSGRYLPSDNEKYWRSVEWLMWQMGGAGPMLGQAHHFIHFNPGKSAYAERRYGAEANRLYGVLEQRLGNNQYLAGDEYTIADIAIWPWIARYEWQGIDINVYPKTLRWYTRIASRPGVIRGYGVPNPSDVPTP